MRIRWWVVRRVSPTGVIAVRSAWPNIWDAKHEAQRWEEDEKVTHDYVPTWMDVPMKEDQSEEGATP